jgi:hypothetical protein
MGEMRNIYIILVGIPKGKKPLAIPSLCVGGRVVLKCILKEYSVRV